MSKITQLDWSKTANQFSVNSCRKFLWQYQASRRADKQALGTWSLSFSEFQILSILLSCYFSESLPLQFSCITVRLSESSFLFAIAGDQFQQKMNFCSILCRSVSSNFSLLKVIGYYDCKELRFWARLGWQKGDWYEKNLFLPLLTQSGPTCWP